LGLEWFVNVVRFGAVWFVAKSWFGVVRIVVGGARSDPAWFVPKVWHGVVWLVSKAWVGMACLHGQFGIGAARLVTTAGFVSVW